MIATGLAAPTQSGAGIAAATASPAVSYAIGQEFKKIAEENKRKGITEEAELTSKQETAHILAHAILGAAVSAAGGNDALAGALSAAGAEAAAPMISKWLYGEQDGSKLTAEQKETVVAITSLLGTAAGATVGDTTANAVSGSLNANSAVGNNDAVLNNPTVRGVGIGGIRTVGVPLIVGVYCLADSNCSDAGNAVIETFNQEAESVRQALNMSSSDNQIENNNETTNSLIGHVSQAATGSPQIEPPDPDDENNSNIRVTHNSIKESPNYPKGFRDIQNGTKKFNINNQSVLDNLRKIESGDWKKVYKNGFDNNGNRISIHYFQNTRTGRVFNVKVKNSWSTF